MKQVEAGVEIKLRATTGVQFNVGDLVGRLADGTACTWQGWPKNDDANAMLAEFAHAFVGISQSHYHSGQQVPGMVLGDGVRVECGGTFEIAADDADIDIVPNPEVVKGTLLRPSTVADGTIPKLTNSLPSHSIGEVVGVTGNVFTVKFRG